MESSVKDFLNQKSFAVFGSFRNETKYAYKILKALIKKGYQVYPVNPRLNSVDGIKCYKNIGDIPFDVDVVNLVTPPSATERIVKECCQRRIKKVWLQPGAESETTIDYCCNNNIDVIYGLCLLLVDL